MNDMGNQPPADDLAAIYGDDYRADETFGKVTPKRIDFAPWHHPVKQRVRVTQWRELVARLIDNRGLAGNVLRYFTLPGPDLLDVRILSEACSPYDIRIEYFGFDDAMQPDAPGGVRVEIEAMLRQSRRITDDALIIPDKLQDIAITNSQAHRHLSQRRPFDVVNVDACEHLAYKPANRQQSIFDALNSLLAHQMDAAHPWLLFVTTRAEPGLMDGPGDLMKDAVQKNLADHNQIFGPALAELFERDAASIHATLASLWQNADADFLKLYAVGLTKFLLQFYAAQPNRPANVELASACAYRVFGNSPDMLALGFRITPGPRVVFMPGEVPPVAQALEPQRAVAATRRARRLRDIDNELAADVNLMLTMARQSAALLSTSNYDIEKYCDWLASHPERPVILNKADVIAAEL